MAALNVMGLVEFLPLCGRNSTHPPDAQRAWPLLLLLAGGRRGGRSYSPRGGSPASRTAIGVPGWPAPLPDDDAAVVAAVARA